MKSKKTTIHDIAKHLNITASTVSRALKNNSRISDATIKSVREAAKELNYQPNNIAAALRKGKSNIVGIIIPMADRNFFASIIRGIEEIVNDAGYNVIICQSNDSPEKEKANISTLLESQVDCIIASYAKKTTDFSHYKEIVERDVPLILFDRLHESLELLDVDAVVIDDYLGSYKATQHLIEQGCRKIVHFSGPQHVSIYKERTRGYMEALIQNGISLDKSLVLESNLKLDAGKQLANDLLTWQELPDAIFSASDYAAMGAMGVLKKNQVKIPEQIAIVGFSNEPFTSFVEPSLSTVDQHSKKMGEYAARIFLDIMNNNNKTHTPTKTVLKPELIIRNSSLKSKD
ncbi:LacI family transcriptional regulator [Rhodohalobacter sp. SW132]|uniref:LacI family DNA-binding transcriptional regulator n=1 Tax=Rhodohalobacter sp. SW132 TaxID=2293433 RepID=UPI000E242C69|nr:LacI family DNA-binding transcriptional regulator [Rhodohalobacter sp. SW132]REL33172.1 LacI family transcriptional regulator [Rhodohalobacter sp. SW132]